MDNIDDLDQFIDRTRDLNTWRFELPNLYDDSGLDVYEFRLLAHYVRVGKCWESTKTTAKNCNMSVGKVSSTRKSLQEKNFIAITEEADKKTMVIVIVDKWKENFDKYNYRSRGEPKNSSKLINLINFLRSSGERGYHPLQEFIDLFGKFRDEDQAVRIHWVYQTYGKERYQELLEWSKQHEYKHLSSRIKAIETAAPQDWSKDNPIENNGSGGRLV